MYVQHSLLIFLYHTLHALLRPVQRVGGVRLTSVYAD
jgi:hypothetical protein